MQPHRKKVDEEERSQPYALSYSNSKRSGRWEETSKRGWEAAAKEKWKKCFLEKKYVKREQSPSDVQEFAGEKELEITRTGNHFKEFLLLRVKETWTGGWRPRKSWFFFKITKIVGMSNREKKIGIAEEKKGEQLGLLSAKSTQMWQHVHSDSSQGREHGRRHTSSVLIEVPHNTSIVLHSKQSCHLWHLQTLTPDVLARNLKIKTRDFPWGT